MNKPQDPQAPNAVAWVVFDGWSPVAAHISSASASADRDRRQLSADLSGNLAAHHVMPAITLKSALEYAEALAAHRVAQERERWANLCEDLGGDNRWSDAHGCAHAIRQNPPETGKEPRA